MTKLVTPPKWCALALALSGCAGNAALPPLAPAADLCIFYQSFRYSPAAAAVEELAALRAHAANESAHYDKCITNHPKLDPGRTGGPR